MRALGRITDEMELLLMEMCDEHEMQWHEILALVHGYLVAHRPDAQEQYEDGGVPVFYYGPERLDSRE